MTERHHAFDPQPGDPPIYIGPQSLIYVDGEPAPAPDFVLITTALSEARDLAHRAANGGLNTAAHVASAGELKVALREIRAHCDTALAELAKVQP